MKKQPKNIIMILAGALAIVEIITFSNICFNEDLKQAQEYCEQGEYSKAVSLCLNLIERDTNGRSDIYILCADAYLKEGDSEAALELLNSAVANGLDESIIMQKINQAQQSNTSKSVELTQDFEVFFDNSIIPFMFILLITICIIPTVDIIYRVGQRKKNLEAIKNRGERRVSDNTTTYDEGLKRISRIGLDMGLEDAEPMLQNAIEIVVDNGFCNTSLLQQKLKLDYLRAAKIVDTMEHMGIVGPYEGSKPRKVLISRESLGDYPVELDKTNIILDDKTKTEASIKKYTIKDVLDYVDKMSERGWEFEKFTAKLLLENGFVKTEVTSGSNDYGVDVVAVDKNDISYAIQCKCYSSKVDNKSVQQVIAGKIMYNCQVGVVLTNNYFTDNAIKLAKCNGISLWDRTKLTELLTNYCKAANSSGFGDTKK